MGEVVQLVGYCRRIDAADNVLNASQTSFSSLIFLIAGQDSVPILSQSSFAIHREFGLQIFDS
jgi:hypothetical protein